VGISLLYATVAGSLVSFVEPLAAGSGIAEVKTYLNGIHIRGLLTVGLLFFWGGIAVQYGCLV
jgi:chloride channel 7